jgi:hypothetical protein
MKTHLNLLPFSVRRNQLIKRALRQWVLAGSIAAAITAFAIWWRWNEAKQQQIALDAVMRQYAPLKKLEEESQHIESEVESLQNRERLALDLAQNRSLLTLIEQLSRAAKRCDGKVNINHLVMDANVRSARQDGEGDLSQSKLTLRGMGIDDVTIAQFVAELRDSNLFENVQLTSTGSATINDREAKIYTLECVY